MLKLGNFTRGKRLGFKEEILAQATNVRDVECQITVGWVPAHSGVPWNEQEVRAAKSGTIGGK